MSDEAQVTRRICESVKREIRAGRFPSGSRLPSTRVLAAEWGVSRTTVTAAYEQLAAEGYLETRAGSRARVAPGLAMAQDEPRPAGIAAPGRRLSAQAGRLAGFATPPRADPARLVADFRYGELAAADFPTLAWRKAVTAALLQRRDRLRYGDPAGSPRLRAALQGYLWRARGIRCETAQILVVNGSQQGLDLCARLLLDPGDQAIVENPCYGAARQVFLAAGAELVPLEVDGEGMRTEGLVPARLAFVTPSHQFPLGGVMPAGRRRALLAWAEEADAHVVEDDYDSEYRFDIGPIPPLQSLDAAGRVIYVGTVSKTLSPALRLGYLVVPPQLAETFAIAKRLTDRHTPSLEQEALASLIESGAYERHVRRARRRNGERRAVLLAELTQQLAGSVTVEGADAGLHLLAWLRDVPAAREEEFVAHAEAEGLGLYPVTPLYAPGSLRSDRAGLVMGYAGLDQREIVRGVERLAALLDAWCERP